MAVFPVAAGNADLSGKYIPQLYASKLLEAFYARTLFGAIANTDYEGMIRQQGDKVIIRGLPDIVIHEGYEKHQALTFETPDPSTVELVIDKGQYFAIRVDAVDIAQADIPFLTKWAVHGAEQAKIAIDRNVLSNIYGSVNAYNKGLTAGLKSASINLGVSGTPLALTKVNVLDTIVDCGTVLDEQDITQEGRFLVLPAWGCGLIKKSDLKDASLTGDGTSIMRNGRLGMIDRFEVYLSNLLSTNSSGGYTATECIFGHKIATTFAMQVTEKKIVDNPTGFGLLLKVLQVYAYKVVQPKALGHLHIYAG